MKITKRKLRKIVRRAINESRYGTDRKLGYGSGSIVADMSDEIMMIIEHTLELGDKSGATEAPEFIEEVKAVAMRTIEAAILEYKRVRR